MTDPAIATAADYADALLTARRAKNLLLLVVFLALLVQLAVFFTAKYTTILKPRDSATFTLTAPTPSTLPTASVTVTNSPNWTDVLHYALGGSIFLGIVCTVMLALVLYLIVKIMLVGRLIGVARLTSAFVWCLFVLLLLFPWQAFLRNADFTSREFIVPGVLYTWDELRLRVMSGVRSERIPDLILFWTRFVAFPIVAIILLLVIHAKSNRGLKQALGEEVFNDTTTTPAI